MGAYLSVNWSFPQSHLVVTALLESTNYSTNLRVISTGYRGTFISRPYEAQL
jgi:hypothetical protein